MYTASHDQRQCPSKIVYYLFGMDGCNILIDSLNGLMGVIIAFLAQSGTPGSTPAKGYPQRKIVNVFGQYQCNLCFLSGRSMEKIMAVPCSRQYAAKIAEMDPVICKGNFFDLECWAGS